MNLWDGYCRQWLRLTYAPIAGHDQRFSIRMDKAVGAGNELDVHIHAFTCLGLQLAIVFLEFPRKLVELIRCSVRQHVKRDFVRWLLSRKTSATWRYVSIWRHTTAKTALDGLKVWRARRDSNPRPMASEATTLSG